MYPTVFDYENYKVMKMNYYPKMSLKCLKCQDKAITSLDQLCSVDFLSQNILLSIEPMEIPTI
jgi:hypothetical protein